MWNWWGSRKWGAQQQRMIDNGAEVLKYVLPVHDYSFTLVEPEQVLWYGGPNASSVPVGGSPREWYWDKTNPSRVMVPNYNGRVMDLRINSAYVNHIMEDVVPKIAAGDPNWRCSGLLLDVTGDGYWGQISGLTTAERAEYSAGIRDFVERLRAALPKHILIGNNSWDQSKGPIDMHGLMIENHSPSEVQFWRDIQIPLFQPTDGRKRCVTINRSVSDAQFWSNVPGVAAAGYDKAQGGAYQIGTVPVGTVPVTAMPGAIDPYATSTPPPDDPPPPPSTTDCSECEAALASTQALLVAVRGERDQALAALANADAAFDAAQAKINAAKVALG